MQSGALPVLGGYIAAIVAGPVSIRPLDWSCPPLAIAPTPSTTAAGCDLRRAAPQRDQQRSFDRRFAPLRSRKPNGDVGAAPWCLGFHAAMQPRLKVSALLLDLSNINHGLLLRILFHGINDQRRPLLGPARKERDIAEFLRNIPAAARRCASTGC